MEVLIRVTTGLLVIIPGALIGHLCPNRTLFYVTDGSPMSENGKPE